MKILIITNKVPYPPKDGGSIATWNLAKSLVENACEVDMLAMNTLKHHIVIEAIKPFTDKYLRLFTVEVDTSISVWSAFTNLFFSHLPYNAQRFINKQFRNKLTELLISNRYDIIQLEGLYLSPYISTIRKLSNALISMRSHNVEHEIWQRTAALTPQFLKKKYFNLIRCRLRKMEICNLSENDLLVPITERDASIFERLGNIKPTQVCSTGICMDNYPAPNFSELIYPSLFHIGALDWSPNQDGLLWFFENIWQKLLQKHPNLIFHLAGRNAPSDFIKKLNIKNIVFHGEVNSVSEFIHNKSVMVVPLLSGSGMRVKIVEGMAYGKCIVSTSIGVEGINALNNKHLLIADSPAEFENAIERAISSFNFYKEIAQSARNFVAENFDNKKMAAQLVHFYQLALNGEAK